MPGAYPVSITQPAVKLVSLALAHSSRRCHWGSVRTYLLCVPSFRRSPWAGVLTPTDTPGGRGSGKLRTSPRPHSWLGRQDSNPGHLFPTPQVPHGHRLYRIPRRGRNSHASELRRCHTTSVQTSQHRAATVTANSEGRGPRRWGRQGTACSIHSFIQQIGTGLPPPPTMSQDS